MEQGLLDVLIALLQSLAVLLLASGVYIALIVRKTDRSSLPRSVEPATGPRVPRSVT